MKAKWQIVMLSAVLAVILSAPVMGADTIKLGGLYNLTGGMSSIDAPALNGAKLQAKLINEAGGVLGKNLEVIGIDTKTDQKAAATGAKKALAMGVVAGLGYGDTTFVMAAAPLFQKKGVPFVTSGATHPMLPKWVGDYMFMVPFGDDDQSFAIAEYTVNKLGAKKVAVWTDNSMDFTKALSKFYKQRITELGGTIVLEDFFMMGDKDFSAQIARLKNADPAPEAVFVSAIPNEAGLTVKQIREAGLTLPIVSGDGFDTELVTTVPGDKLANDVYFSTHTYREDNRPEVLAFVKAYEKEYNRPPENAFAALGFDAVGLIADAIKRANSTDGKALRDALAATKGFKAVTGEISYTRPSGVPMKGVSIISVKNGKYKVEEVWYPKN
ncbi:MAG: ABC transporter substrate-binding protein [Deltaproteobacteria bacterium]|nr:ABC transporter substrate-binding protein [Deltaproteobacteria bacterium]MBW1956187.1 ABC transporter substrate-binding protein [Deltaproteobacteria bacterium]MBW2042956.1 ABC transporter substrate-binding protein [Deltaproteobacteria bacterium]MBW2132545.1 ABC transporter substrate-binding protein [Deltaproteobacteria bacterium]